MLFGKTYGTTAEAGDICSQWFTDQSQIVPILSGEENTSAVEQLMLRGIKMPDDMQGSAFAGMFVMKYLGWIGAHMDANVCKITFVQDRVSIKARNVLYNWIVQQQQETDSVVFSVDYYSTENAVLDNKKFADSDGLEKFIASNTVKQYMDPVKVNAAKRRVAAYLLAHGA